VPVHPLTIGAVTSDQQGNDRPLRTLVLILSQGGLEPADAHLTSERVHFHGPHRAGDAIGGEGDRDHRVSFELRLV